MTTATANILFTDVEESTELRSRLGEAAADRVFVEHERLLTRLVERQHGRVVKTAGDGIMAAFDSASDAVQAAVHMQQAVARRPGGLRIRIGIAAGDVSWENNDCFGLPVVTAARLETAAQGGQILVSHIVHLLAGDRSDAHFETVGALELKGLPGPVEAFSVAWEPATDAEGGAMSVPLPGALATLPGFEFVGRADEWAELDDCWRQVLAGGRSVVLLGGEAGAGKTRLASEFARHLHDEGAAVLFGGCDSQLVVPYQPWVQALDHLLRTLPVDALDADVAADLGALGPVLPRVERPVSRAGATVFDTDAERYRLYSAVDAVLADAARRWPLVVVLDDLQWGGAQTLSLLGHIARSGTAARVLILGTLRDTADEVTEHLAAALADLRRLDTVRRVRVAGLEAHDVASFVAGAAGQELDDDLHRLASAVAARSRGNAFFMGELWRHLVSTGAVVKRGDGWRVAAHLDDAGVPESVREVVAERLARLSFTARRVAVMAAVAGPAIELRVLLVAADATASELTAALDELAAAGLLEAVERPHLEYAFAHALVRESVEAAIPAGSRAQLHLRLGEALEAVHEADRRPVVADLFRHYLGAAALGQSGKAVYYGRKAAEQAVAALAYEEAATHLRAALALAPAGSTARIEVLVNLADALAQDGAWGEAESLCEEAFHLARERGETTLLAEAALGFEETRHSPGLPGEPAVRMVTEAIGFVGDDGSAIRARLEGALARSLMHAGRRAEAHAAMESALAMGRSCGDDDALIKALVAALVAENDPVRILERCAEVDRIAARTGDHWTSAYSSVFQLRAFVILGDLDRARALLPKHRGLGSKTRADLIGHEALHYDVTLAVAEGRFDDAEKCAEVALELGSEKWEAAPGMYGLQMFAIRREQGRLREVLPVLEAVAGREEAAGVWGPGLAVLYAEVGRVQEARAQFGRLAADRFESLPRDSLWPACLAFLADVCVAVEDREQAPLLYEELRAFEGRTLMVGHTVCLGPADRLLGSLAALLGRGGDAERHFRCALELADGAKAPVWRSQVERDLSRWRPLAVSPIDAPPAHPDGLSGREVEVLKLIAAGRSNREIGEHLMISPNTAANHVRAILQKTACANRAEAAAYAARNDLLGD